MPLLIIKIIIKFNNIKLKQIDKNIRKNLKKNKLYLICKNF